ncbi:chondroitin sulfate synthase 1 [Euwallacea fornicatus]|uniref:chondroitin sulfate synthase 1 n=1 Tax=Euwallacea fornicatus TaxID=995702 RepID=UPI00338F1A91
MKLVKPKKVLKIILGVIIGVICSQLFANSASFCAPHILVKQEKLEDDEVPVGEPGLKSKNLLFVGVMTAEQYLTTRAKAVWDTWGKEVPGNLLIFSSENSTSNDIPLVALSGIDDRYPPQKKSFTMLKYMHDNFIDQYEWFMRADDDLYVRTDKLEELLRAVDSKKPFFIGQTGRGTKEERGHLSLDSDENFCMGGPGMIMSRETLKRIAPYIEECLVNLYTTHEDVEIGRCVKKFAGVSCTWNYEMQVIFYHNKSGSSAYSGNLKTKEVHKAITLHPVKTPEYMYNLHTYIKGLKVQEVLHKSQLIHRDIASSMLELGFRASSLENASLGTNVPLFTFKQGAQAYLGDTSLLGKPIGINRYRPTALRDVLEWELISKTLYTHRDLNPRKRIGSSLKEGLGDVTRELMELINQYSKQRGRVIDFREILYGYWRLDPLHGVDLILDLLLMYRKYRGQKMSVQVRRHAYVQQTFSGVFIREIINQGPDSRSETNLLGKVINKISDNFPPLLPFSRDVSESTVINFLLPLSGRYSTFSRFLAMYEEVCIKNWESTRLYVILYNSEVSPSDYQQTWRLINDLNLKISKAVTSAYKKHHNVTVVLGDPNKPFSRASALQRAVNILSRTELVLFIDVDIVFDTGFLQRVRQNTVLGKSVYFPILYSLYSPKLLNIGLQTYADTSFSYFTGNQTDSNRGFWRQFGFGIASMYKMDYEELGGYNVKITGWGTEDVTFFDNIVSKHSHKIVRCVDPGLIHVFHEVNCDSKSLDAGQFTMCLGTRASTLGSLETLQRLFEKYRKLFRFR